MSDPSLTSEEIEGARRALGRAERALNGCLLVKAGNGGGYATVLVKGIVHRAHRLVFRYAVGPIPDGYQIDHVYAWGCRHRNCIEPSHLEAVTPAENIARSGADGGALYQPPSTCPKGHKYVPSNAANRQVECPTCMMANKRKHKVKVRLGTAPRQVCPGCGESIARRGGPGTSFFPHYDTTGRDWCRGKAPEPVVAPGVPTCGRGHPRIPENTYRRPDGRADQCVQCRRIATVASIERKRAKRAA